MPKFNFNDGSYYEFDRMNLKVSEVNGYRRSEVPTTSLYVRVLKGNHMLATYLALPQGHGSAINNKLNSYNNAIVYKEKVEVLKELEEYSAKGVESGKPNPKILGAGLICQGSRICGLVAGMYLPIQFLTSDDPILPSNLSTSKRRVWLFADLDNLTGPIIYEPDWLPPAVKEKLTSTT